MRPDSSLSRGADGSGNIGTMDADRRPRFSGALSTDPDSARAEEQVAERVKAELAGETPDLLTVFVSHHHGGALEGLGPRLARATGM